MAAASPSDEDLQFELAIIQNSIGVSLQNQGKLAEAVQFYRSSMPILQTLASAHPNQASIITELASLHIRMALVQSWQSNFSGALASFRNSFEVAIPFFRLDSANVSAQLDRTIELWRSVSAADDQKLTRAIAEALEQLSLKKLANAEQVALLREA